MATEPDPATAPAHRTLIVANRTATTMELRSEIRRRARARRTLFALLVPEVPAAHGDWTPERAAALLEADAGAPITILGGRDRPYEAVRRALEEHGFDDVVIDTRRRRTAALFRRDLRRRVERLGVPVTVIGRRHAHGGSAGTDPALMESWYRRYDRRR